MLASTASVARLRLPARRMGGRTPNLRDSASTSSCSQHEHERGSPASHKLVSFYALAHVPNPQDLAHSHRRMCQSLGIRGRIYISSQGINAQLSGAGDVAIDYANFVLSDSRFANARFTVSDIESHAFPRLRVKNKELVQQANWWRVDPSREGAGGIRLSPHEWKRALDRLNSCTSDSSKCTSSAADQSNSEDSDSPQLLGESDVDPANKQPLLLDVRNAYEWDAGAFNGSIRPEGVDSFRHMLDEQVSTGGALDVSSNEAKERPVMMYCTGGIRCEFYSEALKQHGFKEVYQLDGGIERYLREVGSEHWNGALFTFDDRLALAPDGQTPASKADDESLKQLECFCCKQHNARAPHRNCANPDCNRLFLCCDECAEAYHGACSTNCMHVESKRPLIQLGESYTRLATYVDDEATVYARRGGGREKRRKRYRERKSESNENCHSEEEQSARKAVHAGD